jgi:glucosylceramidase
MGTGGTPHGGATGTGGTAPGTGGASPGTGGASPGTGGSAAAMPGLVTSSSSKYWDTSAQATVVTSGTATVTVNDTQQKQTWEGFGGAFNEMGWNVLSMLSQSDRDQAMDLLFGTDAAHFSIGRIPIGASDYAIARYSDDETSGDYNMTSFSIAQDMKYLIPYVKAAMAVNSSLRLWGSPWTPPTWMKTTSGSGCSLVGGTMFDGGCMQSDSKILTAYAQYFVKWIQGYAGQGLTIEAVSPQNEPNYAQGYPSCLWASSLFATFVGSNLGPALTAASLNTHVMLGTMSNSSSDPGVVSAVMGNSAAKGFIKVLGYQWGMEGSASGDASKYSPLPIWQTEHRAGNYPFSGVSNPTPAGSFNSSKAPNDQNYAVESWELIREWIGAGVTSYSAWNMVLDTVGKGIDTTRNWPQDALLTVDTSAKKLNITPAYYVFRHVSQFAQPGGHVVSTSGGEALGFKNPDGSLVAVMYNSGSANSSYVVQIGGKKLQFSMPSNGWATVYVPGS